MYTRTICGENAIMIKPIPCKEQPVKTTMRWANLAHNIEDIGPEIILTLEWPHLTKANTEKLLCAILKVILIEVTYEIVIRLKCNLHEVVEIWI